MTPGMPIFSPMMPYGSGLTPQPVQNTNSLSILEEQQRQQQQQQQQQQAQQANSGTTHSTVIFSPTRIASAFRGEIKLSCPLSRFFQCILREMHFIFHSCLSPAVCLSSRSSWNIRTDTTTFPFPDSWRIDHHSTARKYPALQLPADPHDPHHTGHTSLREFWNCTPATVC